MKKWKRLLVLLMTVALCLSLCGCRELDDMKARHATWMEDGNILWNGHTYIPLYNTFDEENYAFVEELNFNDSEVIHITKPDVPVLLSETMGTNGYTGAGGLLVEVNRYVPSIHADMEYTNTVYCRADMYSWTMDALQNGYEIQEYGYYYYDYDTGEEKRGTLNAAQQQAIETVLNTVDPITSEGGEYYAYYDCSLSITAYSTAHLFSQEIGELVYDNGVYSIMCSYYDDDYNRTDKWYDIPKKYNALFNKLFENCGIIDGNGNIVVEEPEVTYGDSL